MIGISNSKKNHSIEEELKHMWKRLWPDKYPHRAEFIYGEKPLHKYVEILAKNKPRETALIYYGRKFSYEELNKFAKLLKLKL